MVFLIVKLPVLSSVKTSISGLGSLYSEMMVLAVKAGGAIKVSVCSNGVNFKEKEI